MIGAFVIALAGQAMDVPPDFVPYQAVPSLMVYSECISSHHSGDLRANSASDDEVRRAYLDAVAACREVRATQLARALREQTDHRLYGTRERAQAAIRRAFDRVDSEIRIEPVPSKPPFEKNHAED